MKWDTRPALIIIGTLLIGMALGALGLSVVVRHRMEKLHNLRSRGGLPERLLESIGPLSADQRGAVTAEFNHTAAQIDSTVQAGRHFIDATLDSLAARVDSQLTPDQRLRLHKELGRRFHGPGPGDPMFGGPPPRDHRDERPPQR
jgi:hypothetical protein